MRRLTARLLLSLLAGALVTSTPGIAHAAAVTIAVDPATAAVGQPVRVTVSGLEGRDSVQFSLPEGGAGLFVDADATGSAETAEVEVTSGTAQVQVTATREGEFVVSVGDGSSVLAQTDIVVTGASEAGRSTPTPASSSSEGDSVQADPEPEAEGGRLAFVVIPVIAALVVVVGAIFVLARGRRSRRGD